MLSRPSSLLAVALLAVVARGQTAAGPDPYGLDRQKGSLTLTGSATVHGAKQKFELTFDREFRYRLAVSGPVPQIECFDGVNSWTDGPSGVPHKTYTFERDSTRLAVWTMLGLWADRRAPVQKEPDPKGAESTRTIKTRDGKLAADLSIDASTGLAASLTYDSAEGPQAWQFDDYRDFEGRTLPTHIVLHSGGQDDVYDVESVSSDRNALDQYKMPPPDLSNFSFDSSVSPQVELKRIAGYLFVRPRIDGQDVGWFFLDCGADVLCLDPTVTKKLGMPKVGSDTTAGAVAVAQYNLDEGHSLQLGPITLKNPIYLEFDLRGLTGAFRIPVVGVCGYDVFARAIIDVDPKAKTIGIYDPDHEPDLNGVRWEAMKYAGNAPVVEAEYAPGHRGSFHLDTGSGNTVDFFSPTVSKYHLSEGPDIKKTQTGGAGGTAVSLSGPIDWFDLGGSRIVKPIVGFQTVQAGVFGTALEDGNIGMGFMGQFRMIFDYPHSRVGFEITK